MRLNEGDIIFLTNGKGMLCEAVITNASPKVCVIEIVKESWEFGKRDFNLSIAIAPTKKYRKI